MTVYLNCYHLFMAWLIFLIFALFFAKLGVKPKGGETVNNKAYIIARIGLVVTLSVMTGFGGISGTDHDTYVSIYNTTTNFDDLVSLNKILSGYMIEPGYSLLNIVCNKMEVSEPYFFFVVACITHVFFVWIMYKYKNPWLVILLLVPSNNYSQEINLVRQCVAVNIFACAVYMLWQKRYKTFGWLSFLAFSFHSTVILLLPFCLIFCLNFEKRKKTIFSVALCLWIFSLLMFYRIVNFPIIENVLSIFGQSRYDSYVTGDNDMGLNDVPLNYTYNISMILVLISMRTKISNEAIFMLLGCILVNFNLPFTIRMGLYFTIFMPLSYGSFLRKERYILTPGIRKFIPTILILYYIFWVVKFATSYVLGSPIFGVEFYKL